MALIQKVNSKKLENRVYSDFADILEKEGIKMTLLLSVEQLPEWLKLKEEYTDLLKSETAHALPALPGSEVWESDYIKNWIGKVIKELENYMRNGTITEILIGNEMMYNKETLEKPRDSDDLANLFHKLVVLYL